MTCSRRAALSLMAGAGLAAPSILRAQDSFPARAVRLVVPYPPGGATDLVARVVADGMSSALGQPVVVDNRPGAGTMIGAVAVARADADGYTLLLGDTGTYAFNATLYRDHINYDATKDFRAVCLTGHVPLILVAHAASFKGASVADLVQIAKAEPGKLNYAAPGPGSPIHLAMESFKQATGIVITPVPYKGGADALQDLVGGRVELGFFDIATSLPYVKEGTLKVLGTGSPTRAALLPNVPTMQEAGLVGFDVAAWNGIVAPRGAPDAAVKRLNEVCNKVLSSAAVRSRLIDTGVEPAGGSAEEFGRLIVSETGRWHDIIERSGIKL